jgi:hypothetical protein
MLAFFFAIVVGAMIAHFFVGLDDDHRLKNWMIQTFGTFLADP